METKIRFRASRIPARRSHEIQQRCSRKPLLQEEACEEDMRSALPSLEGRKGPGRCSRVLPRHCADGKRVRGSPSLFCSDKQWTRSLTTPNDQPGWNCGIRSTELGRIEPFLQADAPAPSRRATRSGFQEKPEPRLMEVERVALW